MAVLDGATAEPATTNTGPLEREAFTALPYGLLVLDRGGRVLCANVEATRLIEAAGLRVAGLSCCSLLGCRRPDSVLAGGCLTDMALGSGGGVPEMRAELSTPRGPLAVWVAVGPLRSGREGLVAQLRPAFARDRRRRSDPEWTLAPLLRISCLGRTLVRAPEGQLAGAWLDQRTGQLLKYLLAERHRAVTVDEIAESLWSNADCNLAGSVRYYVHALRSRLEPGRGRREPPAFVLSGGGAYRLDPERVEVDADEFEARVSAGLASLPGDPAAAARQIERGLELYGGEFLADVPYADWAMPERHRLHDLACTGLHALAEIHLAEEAIEQATRALQRLTALQPYDEDVHRRLIELDMRRGRRSDALRRYAALRARTRRAFGHDLGFTPGELMP